MRVVLSLLFLLLIPLVHGVTFIDITTGEEIDTAIIRHETPDGNEDYLMTPTQPFHLSGRVGTLFLRVRAEETYDYMATTSEGEQVLLHPIGLVQGTVKDAQENHISGATVKLACPTTTQERVTDAVGSFRVFLPPGTCTFSALKGGRIGTVEAVVVQGQVTRPTVMLQQTSSTGMYWLVLLLLIGVLVVFVQKKKSRPIPKKSFVVDRVKEVLTVKEKLIVDELLLRGGSMTLTALRQATKIPRTSLIRTLQTLEHRSLVMRTTKHGKNMVELTK